MTAAAVPADPVLEMRQISKSFAGVPALTRVGLRLSAGEVHALMGENGAGKSTLVKILSGVLTEYDGVIELHGRPVRFAGVRDAERHGIAIIHQELNLVPELSVAENIFLGREPAHGGVLIKKRELAAAARALMQRLGLGVDPRAKVASLRVAERQLVEIAKALSLEARVLVMDEPTSALSVAEALRLHAIVRRLAGDGVAVVYISHRMEEVIELARTITVLRDGRLAGTLDGAATSRRELIAMMAGREVQEFLARGEASADDVAVAADRRPLLSVRGLWLANPRPTAMRPRLVDGLDLDVAAGEVLGLAGLMGAGRTELLETLFGARPEAHGGEIRIDGVPVRIGSPQAAKRAGLALVTEDRKLHGLVVGATLGFNVALPVLRSLARGGVVRPGAERGLAARTIERLRIRAQGPQQPVGTLSGGNQQKVVLGKWLATRPRVLLLDEPTRGIDVGAKAEIYRLVRELAGQGLAIVVASSEMPELMALSDRILVLREGRPTALLGHRDFVADTILDHASPGGEVQPAFARLVAPAARDART